ncbi:MAG TPA: hypothetical protein HPP77_03880 [Candidatus Hydrogenedentes bacterium]|nr:hypothetical protein [Candidatus Hydrogenedentota bacterium]
MHRIRVYVDTSVFGGTQDDEFAEPSRRFSERVYRGEFVLLLSSESLRELSKAPDAVRVVWESLPVEAVEGVPINTEVEELAKKYLSAHVLGEGSEGDALHVAAATASGCRPDSELELQTHRKLQPHQGFQQRQRQPRLSLNDDLKSAGGVL